MFLARAREVAEQSNGRLVVLTDFLTGDIRSHLQMGSDVMVIPSLYEPGGMPSEAYAALTPVIANATGGLRRLVKHFGPENPAGSGFHFGIPGAYEPAANTQWHQINGQYDPAERMKVPVYRGLVESLSSTIEHFVDFYRFNPDMYALMLSNLPSQLSNVSWVPSVVEYSKLFDVASSPQYRIASV
jgi:glycogen synthase